MGNCPARHVLSKPLVLGSTMNEETSNNGFDEQIETLRAANSQKKRASAASQPKHLGIYAANKKNSRSQNWPMWRDPKKRLSLSQVFAIAGGLAPSQVRQIIHEYEDMHQLVSFSLPLLEARPR